jgi:hypothetical protein
MPPNFNTSDGVHNFFIDMHDIFYSKENIDVKSGDIVEVDYRDRKNKRDPLLLRIIANAEEEGSTTTTSAQSAVNSGGENTGPATVVPDGKCGDGSSGEYASSDCYSGKLSSNGKTVTLHPVFWAKVEGMLNQIKAETNTVIPIKSSYRSKQNQFDIRKSRCPKALIKLGEQRFKTESWDVLEQNGPCDNHDPVGPVEGAGASNHIKGLAVDFIMDIECPSLRTNSAKYENCKNNSATFKLLTKYAPIFGIKNWDVEPWHWSHNGR